MVEAQTRMDTAQLIALMVMAALVGWLMDFAVVRSTRFLTAWRDAD